MNTKEQKQDYWWAFPSKKYLRTGSIFFIVLMGSCAVSKSLPPTEEQVGRMQEKVPGITLEKARAGYAIYSSKCGGCHRLYAPDGYTAAQWDKILPRMVPKARIINEEEKQLVRNYLYALSQ